MSTANRFTPCQQYFWRVIICKKRTWIYSIKTESSWSEIEKYSNDFQVMSWPPNSLHQFDLIYGSTWNKGFALPHDHILREMEDQLLSAWYQILSLTTNTFSSQYLSILPCFCERKVGLRNIKQEAIMQWIISVVIYNFYWISMIFTIWKVTCLVKIYILIKFQVNIGFQFIFLTLFKILIIKIS